MSDAIQPTAERMFAMLVVWQRFPSSNEDLLSQIFCLDLIADPKKDIAVDGLHVTDIQSCEGFAISLDGCQDKCPFAEVVFGLHFMGLSHPIERMTEANVTKSISRFSGSPLTFFDP
jgi:hypothetical protein